MYSVYASALEKEAGGLQIQSSLLTQFKADLVYMRYSLSKVKKKKKMKGLERGLFPPGDPDLIPSI